jgi:phosphatidylglycerophosphatase A
LSALARLIATWFGCGYAPKAPGTAGSLAALAIAWLLHAYAGVPALAFAALSILLAIPGIWAASAVARDLGKEDPQIVVVDEVVGQWMTLAGATALNWKSWLLAFALFRLFDIWKPPPVRQLERLSGGLGIVADDAMAGVYGALVLFAAGWFNLY